MTKLLILKGLPGSGKTTYAQSLCAHEPDWRRVNRDDIRATICAQGQVDEGLVLQLRNDMICRLVEAGYNVVVDDTNLTNYAVSTLLTLADILDLEVDILELDVPTEVCIRRDQERLFPVGEVVIRRMAELLLS